MLYFFYSCAFPLEILNGGYLVAGQTQFKAFMYNCLCKQEESSVDEANDMQICYLDWSTLDTFKLKVAQTQFSAI